MFDRCHRWQQMLNRRADTALSVKEQDALNAHLALCDACRQRAAADEIRFHVLGIHTGILDREHAREFDDHVVSAAIMLPTAMPQATAFGWARKWCDALPFPFLGQLLGGGLAAAALTVISLSSTLHPTQPPISQPRPSISAAQNEPPIPLEALLDSPSPRAALLWRTSNKAKLESPRKPEPNKLPLLRVTPNGKPKGASLDLSSHAS